MAKQKDSTSPAARMQAHMGKAAMDIQADAAGSHHPVLPERFREETEQIISILDEIRTLTSDAAAATDALLTRCKETGLNNSTYSQAQDYWYQLANDICSLEELLWIYCDESWFSRNALTRELVTRKDLMGDTIEIQICPDHALIRMPHIPATRKKNFTLAEDLLWSKLLMLRDLPQWDECHAAFCHVYPVSVSQMPKDIDNYDYKRTIDILSYSFGFSDCPETFSMSMESMLSDDIPSGTYILLEPKLPKKLQNLLKTHSPDPAPKSQNVQKSIKETSEKETPKFKV